MFLFGRFFEELFKLPNIASNLYITNYISYIRGAKISKNLGATSNFSVPVT